MRGFCFGVNFFYSLVVYICRKALFMQKNKKLEKTFEKIGDYLLDVSKLVLAGVVLSSLLAIPDIPKIITLTSGIIATMILAVVGFYFIREA